MKYFQASFNPTQSIPSHIQHTMPSVHLSYGRPVVQLPSESGTCTIGHGPLNRLPFMPFHFKCKLWIKHQPYALLKQWACVDKGPTVYTESYCTTCACAPADTRRGLFYRQPVWMPACACVCVLQFHADGKIWYLYESVSDSSTLPSLKLDVSKIGQNSCLEMTDIWA